MSVSSEERVLSRQVHYVAESPSELSPAVQINGRRVLGPPIGWLGPPPSTACELFIKRIPKCLVEDSIVQHFQRFGPIYEFRLMMDFNELNRGYGYVKYINEEDANRALEVMNHFFILPKKVLEIQHSYDKCRLFVGNIPKELTKEEIEAEFRAAFPKLEKVVMHTRISDGNKNRGFVFIDFPNHQEALLVKKRTTPGRLRKWGRDLKIVWANPERCVDPAVMKEVKTLFVRNIDLSVNNRELYNILVPYVARSEIQKISRVREFAFIDFASRQSAEIVKQNLQGAMLKDHVVEFDWAMPASEKSVHSLRNSDFDAALRLKCIANYWSVPIIIFGRVYQHDQLQYAAVMLRHNNIVRAFIVELQTQSRCDIHSRLCEVVVTLIEHQGGLPSANYIIKVNKDIAYLVGAVIDFQKLSFVPATNIPHDLVMYWEEIRDLAVSIAILSEYSDEYILQMYEKAMQKFPNPVYMDIFGNIERVCGWLKPNYRNKPPLKYNLDNTQITLALCSTSSLTNYIFPNKIPILYNFRHDYNTSTTSGFSYSCINLLPSHFAQSRCNESPISVVYYGTYFPNIPLHSINHTSAYIPQNSPPTVN